jgi:hypothetical protein
MRIYVIKIDRHIAGFDWIIVKFLRALTYCFIDVSECPKIIISVKINSDLTVKVYNNEAEIKP